MKKEKNFTVHSLRFSQSQSGMLKLHRGNAETWLGIVPPIQTTIRRQYTGTAISVPTVVFRGLTVEKLESGFRIITDDYVFTVTGDTVKVV